MHIALFIDKFLSASHFSQVLFVWTEKCRFLQQQLKLLIIARRKNYEKLVIKWNIAEYNLFIKKKQKKQKKHSPKNKFLTCVPTQINTEGVTMIPLDIKKYIYVVYWKEKFMNLLRAWKLIK